MQRRLTCVLLVAALLALLLPAGTRAYVVGGDRWPGTTISYWVAANGYAGPVDRAAQIWNRAGVGARLVRASRADAEVTVVYGGRRCESSFVNEASPCCSPPP